MKKIIAFLRNIFISKQVRNYNRPVFPEDYKGVFWNKLWIGPVLVSIMNCAISAVIIWVFTMQTSNEKATLSLIVACFFITILPLLFVFFPNFTNINAVFSLICTSIFIYYLRANLALFIQFIGVFFILDLGMVSVKKAKTGPKTNILSYSTFTDRIHIQTFSSRFYGILDSKRKTGQTLYIQPVVDYSHNVKNREK